MIPKDSSKPAQPGGCVLCHVGSGRKPNPVDKLGAADFDDIDCLICHAPGYKRMVVKEGESFRLAAADGVDIIRAARDVRKPTTEMCLRCHAAAGGGPNHKHGVIPTKDSDVHVARGIVCVDCHKTVKHKVAGGADLKAQELTDVKVACENCHSKDVHKGGNGAVLDRHSVRIACQTCHIPAIARDPGMPTMTERDWTQPVLNEKTGLYGPSNKFASNVKPEYRWWNRMMKAPPEPVGSINDPGSKIYPWKRTRYTVIADAATNQAVFIKAGLYAVTGDVGAAAKKGAADAKELYGGLLQGAAPPPLLPASSCTACQSAEDVKQDYSGQWKGAEETMVFSVNHQVAPKREALTCDTCHSDRGVMDFRALGYPEERVRQLVTGR